MNVCPRCSTPIEGDRMTGIWTGALAGTNQRITGPSYAVICKRCGAELYSLVTREEAEAREFLWELRSPAPRSYKTEKREREELLEPLLQAHAERSPVMDSLKLEFKDFSVGSSHRSELKKWLFLDEVNDAANHFPGIFFHIDDITMTWLFFDFENRLQGYFVRRA